MENAGRLAVVALALTAVPERAEADAGFWKQFVILNRGNGNEYLGNPLAANFNGTNLGTWVQGDLRYLNGAEANSWEDGGDWVESAHFNYRFGTSGDFTEIALGQRSHSGNDRMWDQTAQNILLTGRDPGTYTLQVYFRGRGRWSGGGWDFYDNATPDYGATFTVVALGDPSGPTATALSGNTIELEWTRWSNRNVVIVRNLTGSFTAPTNGAAPPVVGQSFAGGALVYNGSGTTFNDTGLTEDTTYHYRFFSINHNYYAPGVGTSATTLLEAIPAIAVGAGEMDFGEVDLLTVSDPETYTVVGSALTEGITVTAPEGFEIAASPAGPYGETVALPQGGGTVWIRYSPAAIGEDVGIVTFVSTGAETQERTVRGEGTLTLGTPQWSLANSTEVILQYFGTSWREITRRMPEVAEAGYTSLWLPPPFKASGGLSVGFDTCDRFDLGNKFRHGLATKYGTKTDLLQLMEVAHRFGLRVYFDNVMAHTGGFSPSGEPYELNDLGFVPADFHLIRREDGTYYKMDWPEWTDEWQVLYRNPFSWDISTDWGGNNNSFGAHEGAVTQKWVGVRQPDHPAYYDFAPGGTHVGFGNVTQEMLDDHPAFYEEEVNAFLNRAVRWFIDVTKADGFRLDAVKHVRADFFGAEGEGSDSSNFGYTGQIQWQYNKTHGFEDWSNHRDAVFDPSMPRNDAMNFGEHLGSPPSEGPYLARGMRIANDNFIHAMNDNVGGDLSHMDARDYGIYGVNPNAVAHYVMSHDNNYLWGGDALHPWGNRPQAHALMLAREGLPIVYTDGYNQSGEPDWFPKPAHVPFLGQYTQTWGGAWLPNLLHIRRHFGWGGQWGKWSDQDHAVWVRGLADNHDGASMMFAAVRRFAGGDRAPFELVDSVFNEGDILYKYSHWGSFPVRVHEGKIREMDYGPVLVGPGDWWAVSWRIPEMPRVWRLGDWWDRPVQPIVIEQNGQPVEHIWVARRDGRDGDPAFNPYGLPNADTTNYTYHMPVPRVTSSSNVAFVARADGTADNVLMKLDGGIDLNAQMWSSAHNRRAGARDNPPGEVTDLFLGFEQMQFAHRIAEKFASVDTAYNRWGSYGATSYETTVGASGFTIAQPADLENDWQADYGPRFLYHEPTESTEQKPGGNALQFLPAPEAAASQPVTMWVKTGAQDDSDRVFLYYTADGATWPEGSGGVGGEATEVVEFASQYIQSEGTETNEWWMGTLPAHPAGTVLRYKIGGYRETIGSLFPYSEARIDLAQRMETKFVVTNFNAGAIRHFPHNNWNVDQAETGLREGFHVLRTKALLGRASGHAPIYRERVQTFYYDVERPTGYFIWPPGNGEWMSGSYGFVLRTDLTVTEVWYRIEESENEEDWTPRGWVRASRQQVAAPAADGTMEQEWRFDYDEIPSSGWARVDVVLREVSSSEDVELSDEAGHFTTLTRTMFTGGGYRIRIMNPPARSVFPDGAELEVWLSRELWDGIGPDQQLGAFTLSVNGMLQPGVDKRLVYDVSGGEGDHALYFSDLPPLASFSSDPDYEHVIEVFFDRSGFDSRRASRLFRATELTGFSGWLFLNNLPMDTEPDAPIAGHDYTYGQAYIAGIDPQANPPEYVVVDMEHDPNTQTAVIGFPTYLNRHYYILATDSLRDQPFLRTHGPIAGSGGRHAHAVDGNIQEDLHRFYRLEVVLPQQE